MDEYKATRIAVPGTEGTLFIGPIPRDEQTLERLLDAGIDAVLTLATADELAEHGVANMRDIFLRHAVSWSHFPIRDFDIPTGENSAAWTGLETILVERLKAGGEILIHCRAGFGRSGMIAARLLMACGCSADDAVATIRTARPGTIETPEQLAWATRTGVEDAA